MTDIPDSSALAPIRLRDKLAAIYRVIRGRSPPAEMKAVLRRLPFVFAQMTMHAILLRRCLIYLLDLRWPSNRLHLVSIHVAGLERQVTNIAREAGSNGRRLVSYTDIDEASRTVGRFLAFTAFVSRLAPDAATLARDVEELSETGIGDSLLLLIRGRAALKRGDAAEAAALARRSLMIQAVCKDSQKLLYDALKMQQRDGTLVPPTDISIADLSARFCDRPFTTLVSGNEGRTFVCDCPAYLPIATGNLLYSANAEEVWNSPVAQEIRRSILDGDFSHCSRTLCGLIKEDLLPRKDEVTDPGLRRIIDERQTRLDVGPRTVQLSHDPSCNLACPSCRNEIITLRRSELGVYEQARDRVVLPLLARTKGTVMVSGGGDPFASKHYRSILSAIDAEIYPDLSIAILTNALVLTPTQWEEFRAAHPLIKSLLVSVDAARPATYADLRRPGRLDRLLPNLEFLAEQRRAGAFGLFGLCFVVQQKNFREMPEFVELGTRLGVDLIWFQRLVNFGTFDEQNLRDADVADPNNPLHGEFQAILADPRMKHPSVHLFSQFLDR